MQKKHLLIFAALFAATPALWAQDDPKQPKPAGNEAQYQMPDPKHPGHEALKTLVGNWYSKATLPAMPGVPGMEKDTECEGFDRAELILNGLWLKWSATGTFGGQPVQGLWLVGYNPFANKYISVWASSMESAPIEMEGSFDEQTRTWTFTGKCSHGDMHSTISFTDADTMVETCKTTPPGGETHTMVITRKRTKADAVEASVATAAAGAELSSVHRELQQDVGTWDAVVRSWMNPSQPPMEEKGVERISSICGGRFSWSDYQGSMMGAPFTGHALVGYDETTKQYSGYWIDSMSATWASIRGSRDEDSDKIVMKGSCLCPEGRPMAMTQVLTRKDKDNRLCQMEFVMEAGTHKMEIAYKRKAKK